MKNFQLHSNALSISATQVLDNEKDSPFYSGRVGWVLS
jgi:hypothetical protein